MINSHAPDFEITPVHPQRRHFSYALADKNTPPVVTIVTPFYNTGEVFHQTAQSVFQQSLQQFEWLIINDGSDDTQAIQILEQYRNKDVRIRVIDHPENRGLSAARNTGFREAHTEYVLLLDSDDLLEPTAAEKWWWFLETHPQFGFVASYHVAFEGKNYLWTGGFHDGAQNAERNRVSMMCMIRKSVHQMVGGFDETIRGGLEDWEFWMRCAAQGYWGATVPEFLAWYRTRSDHNDRWQNLREERISEFREQLRQKYPGLYRDFPSPQPEPVDLDLTQVTLKFPAVNLLEKARFRLLLILPWLVMGGAERFTLNLIDQLEQKGWQITVVATTPADHTWLSEFTRRCEDLFILPHFLPIRDYLHFLGYLINSRGFDALLLQGSLEGYRLAPSLHALFPQLLILDYLHMVTPDWMDGGFPRLSYLYRDGIDLTITSCQQVREWMMAQGMPAEHLRVCPIGVDAERWKPDAVLRQQMRGELGIAEDEVVIVYAARLEAQKQPMVFAKTLHLLVRQGYSFRAIVVGDGSLRQELERKIQVLGLQDRVRLLGAVEGEHMPALLAAADIFFLPSQNEGISAVLYEAMSAGLPVVAADVGGQAELITPRCGILLPEAPPEQQPALYAQALRRLLKDSDERVRMGMAGRERILSGFTVDHMGEGMIAILAEAMHLKRQGRLKPPALTEEESHLRETQHVIEYLQARREYWNLQRQTQDLLYKHEELSKAYLQLQHQNQDLLYKHEELSKAYLRMQHQNQDLLYKHEELSKAYFQLLQPKPPRHYFYLWIRQLFLPIFDNFKKGRLGRPLISMQKWLKSRLIKE